MAAYTVNPGDLRTKITFQQPTQIADAGGAQITTWANVSTNPTVWARWVNAHGNAHGQEVISSGALQSTQRATVTIRYRADVTTDWRVLKNGEAWQVLSVDHVQDHRRWTEMVVERIKGAVSP
jgi:SPP1 family predicted phage head-tail adaptor